ncbi:glycosyltransferase family 4 protein [Cohnella fermenti]|uniref:Glycosyltransferase family 4 protein n=1 Tax=Cohnella fermenti TaxID=2565925 RepID=A0A4S4BG36_9BACL|nr:glycosyltransferase family 4 protein [Cohnella fermenti]THF73370.1 glycosyltransferase family 4 protein [Cohnella fermenti]
MKLLFVFVLPSGGVDTLNRMRVRALGARGIEAHLLYFRSGSGSANNEGITVHYTSDPAELRTLIHRENYAAIVVVSFFLELALFRDLGYKGLLLFEIQGFGPQKTAREALTGAASYLEPHADAFLYPCTPHIGAILRERYPTKPIYAFNNPFDAEQFHYKRITTYPRPVLAWIGRLDENKNWRDFVTIAAMTAQRVPELEVWMFSDPWLAEPGEQEKLDVRLETLGISRRVFQVHHIAHVRMPDFYSVIGDSGGVLCMTSKAEGAPYTALEALSCRCPVVTSDSDGVRSALIDGKTALYYDHGDLEGARDQVVRLMTSGKLRESLIKQGERHIRDHFTLQSYADRFVRMLKELGVKEC